MTAAALMAQLRARGVDLQPEGDGVRYRARRGVLTPADLEALRAHKAELLAELRQAGPDLTEGDALETRARLGSVLIRSPRFGEVWIAFGEDVATELQAEESERAEPRPVLLPADIATLRGKPEAAIRAALEVARAFPGARVMQ